MSRNVTLINIHTMCNSVLFLLPVIVPYYKEIGLTFQQFLIGEAVFSVVVLLAEVPSGWISDVWKRRTTLMLGAVIGIIGYSTILYAENFWQAVLAQTIIGVAVALNSGTNTALLYDTLLEEGRIEEYRRLDGKRHALGVYGVAFSALAGAFFFTLDFRLPAYFDVLAVTGGLIAISMVREPVRQTKSVEKHIFHDIWETMKYALSGHKEIAGIIMLSTVILCASKLMMWTQQPYYELAGVPIVWFGVLMAGSYVIGGLAGQWSHRIEHWGSNRAALAVMAAVLCTACSALAFGLPAWAAVPMFLTGTFAYTMGTPRINNAINSRVGSERRATILSTANLMVHVLFVPTSLIVGAIADHADVYASLLWIAGQIAVLGGIGLWLWGRRSNPQRVS